jgi:hypothetical protein
MMIDTSSHQLPDVEELKLEKTFS